MTQLEALPTDTRQWLRSKGNSIEGGTSAVQLNVIAKRVLGLPDILKAKNWHTYHCIAPNTRLQEKMLWHLC